MTKATILACTPSSAKRIYRSGPQNVGYGTIFSLMTVNRQNLFSGHRLWIKDGRDWRHIASFNRDGWTSELTDEVEQLIDECIDASSLADYIKWINSSDGAPLTDDLTHWAERGVTTARDLANYLDGCVAREIEKAERRAA